MKNIKNYLFLIAFSFIVFLVHFLINTIDASWSIPVQKLFKIQGFVFLFTLTVIFLSLKILSKFPDKVGFTYLGLVLFKMIAAVFFLYEYIFHNTSDTKKLIIHFFIIFFLYIIFEVWFLINQLNKKNDSLT